MLIQDQIRFADVRDISEVYSPHRNCGGGVISEIWIFFQAFQFITTPPIYDFGKIFFQDTENCPKSFKFMQFLAKFRPFFPIFPPPPIYYNPPISNFGKIFQPPLLIIPPPYNYGGESTVFLPFTDLGVAAQTENCD